MRGAAAAALVLLGLAGCIRTERTTVEVTPDPVQPALMRSAANLPMRFAVVVAATTPGDCPPQLRDEGLGTLLLLQRSTLRQVPDSAAAGYRAFGDYSTQPRGRYGEEAGEGIRVDCARLRALGVIPL